ncbi:MAG TPA: LysM domain-containing protein [Kiritimatiellia bacterium]|nr:LysM domain-containing protein [Kiritimatiellia bacterium]HMO98509.1 LysM domain-containing protein [Kiritimatiellia bacterium]HMP95817.1 LysM domain-containing protein [Kiritimatiellia bacterium]
MTRIVKAILFLSINLSGAHQTRAGTLTLSRSGDAYTLVAEQAILSDILAEIDRQEPAALRFFGDYSQAVSATYRNVALDTLLYRLGVSYVLTYEADDAGEYRLSDAMTLDSGSMGVDPDTAAKIRKLIRDLRDDNIPNNATAAIHNLREMGCVVAPFLEEALYDQDFQARHIAANMLRLFCPSPTPSDRLIELSFELLDQDDLDYNFNYLVSAHSAFELLADSNIYPRVRSRILNNLSHKDARTRLYSALIAAQHRETAMTETLVRIMAPHLADNDLRGDAAACAYAIHQLGPAVLPYLRTYRTSSDVQQTELANLIYTSLETGAIPDFAPAMYASYNRMPIEWRPYVGVTDWNRNRFPDQTGQYHNLSEPRRTVTDYFGAGYNSSYYAWQDEQRRFEEMFTMPEIRGYYFDPHDNPAREPAVEAPFPYTVRSGETMESISSKFATTPEAIIKLNPLLPQDRSVESGMVMRIPWD